MLVLDEIPGIHEGKSLEDKVNLNESPFLFQRDLYESSYI